MNSSHELLLVGLPASGKSTFLAALFHHLQRGTRGLRLTAMPDERDYLIELEKEWLSLRPLSRSQLHAPKRVLLSVSEDSTGRQMVFDVPDVVGEVYEAAWEQGTWNEEVRDRVLTCTGLVLFVRADDVRRAELIDVTVSGTMGERDELAWDPQMAPTQAKLCDLLEQISRLRDTALPSLAVVVSAWDAVAEEGVSPSQWLEWELPLLSQWLHGRSPKLEFSVFGISAQGGDVHDDAVRRALAREACDRPVPVGGVEVVAPLLWLATAG